MTMRAPLGWLQLRHRPLRLLVAMAGIAFAVLLANAVTPYLDRRRTLTMETSHG